MGNHLRLSWPPRWHSQLRQFLLWLLHIVDPSSNSQLLSWNTIFSYYGIHNTTNTEMGRSCGLHRHSASIAACFIISPQGHGTRCVQHPGLQCSGGLRHGSDRSPLRPSNPHSTGSNDGKVLLILNKEAGHPRVRQGSLIEGRRGCNLQKITRAHKLHVPDGLSA